MIILKNLEYTANRAEKSSASESGFNENKDLSDEIELFIFQIEHEPSENPIVRCLLIKQKQQKSNAQTSYKPKQKDWKCNIDLESQQKFSKHPSRYSFELKSFYPSANQINQPVLSRGSIDFSNKKSDKLSIAAFDQSQKFVKGFLTFEYQTQGNFNPSLITSESKESVSIYIFGIKSLIHGCKHKRAFLTISQLEEPSEKNYQDQIIENQQSALKTKKLQVRRVQKGWIWYKEIVDIQLSSISKDSVSISLNLYSFDFNSCESSYICSYRGPLFTDFTRASQVKFTQLQMTDQLSGSEDPVANIEFKYCLKSQTNLGQANSMSSSSYLENAFSPSQFVYDNKSFISNASLVKNRPNQNLNLSLNLSPKNSLLNLNKSSRNIFVKSKFHSVFSSNKSVAMDRQQRFPSPKKKLTDQLGYYAHKTLDINELPTREKYRFSSFGKDSKQCLKLNAFNCAGPGAARYRLPSVFDKY